MSQFYECVPSIPLRFLARPNVWLTVIIPMDSLSRNALMFLRPHEKNTSVLFNVLCYESVSNIGSIPQMHDGERIYWHWKQKYATHDKEVKLSPGSARLYVCLVAIWMQNAAMTLIFYILRSGLKSETGSRQAAFVAYHKGSKGSLKAA